MFQKILSYFVFVVFALLGTAFFGTALSAVFVAAFAEVCFVAVFVAAVFTADFFFAETLVFLIAGSKAFPSTGITASSSGRDEEIVSTSTKAVRDLSLKVYETESADRFRVLGRGEMHISILVENMRREGFEFQASTA